MLTLSQEDAEGKPRYTKLQATQLIRIIASSSSGRIFPSNHAKKMMGKRDISNQDILRAFKYGKVIDEPEPDIRTGEWKYKIVGNGIDIDNLSVVVTINEDEQYLIIITVF